MCTQLATLPVLSPSSPANSFLVLSANKKSSCIYTGVTRMFPGVAGQTDMSRWDVAAAAAEGQLLVRGPCTHEPEAKVTESGSIWAK